MSSNFYNMLDSTGASGFLPTVTFTSTDASFTALQRITQLNNIGITGYYEADFADNITDISFGAFQNDLEVVVVTINKVANIRSYAFDGCIAMRSITLDTAVDASGRYVLTSIGTNAFQGCTSLRNLHIPDTVKQIPDYLCDGCTSLEIAVMGYGCAPRDANDNYIVDASINQYAFYNCPKLSYFIIPETVGYVGNYAFYSDPSLSYVAILGKPTFGTSVFGGTTLNTNAAIYVYDICQNLTSVVPSSATNNQYYEYEFAASSGTNITGADVLARFNGLSPTPSWVKVKLKGTGTGSVVTLGSASTPAFRAFEMNATNYSKVIGFSFPNSLTTSFYGAFENWNSAAGPVVCNMAAHYMPNSFTTTTPDVNGNTVTFHLSTDALMISSQTRQIVFQSGPNKVQLGLSTFLRNSVRAIVIYDVASTHATNTLKGIPSTCFQNCFYLQFCNFFQKNAYSTFNRINANAFQSTFMSGYANSGTHYVYIPKQIQGTGFSNVFLGTTANIVFTVYDKYLDGTAGNGIEGLGTNTAGTASYITTAGFGIVAANATVHLICNWYNSNGLLTGTFNAFGYNYHLLFHPSINTIPNRFAGNVNLKTIAISDTITDINTSAFSGCTGLTRLNISPSSNLTSVGASAFLNCSALTTFFIPNSLRGINASTFSGCTTMASVTYGNNPGIKYIGDLAFYNTTKSLANMFIPSSVVFIGNRVFLTSDASNVNILSTVTFGAGSRIKSIDYKCFGSEGPTIALAAQYLHDIVLPSSLRYIGNLAIAATTASLLQNTHRLSHSANLIVPSSVEVIPWAFLYADSGTVDISNVYFPRSITNVAGPRVHGGYSVNGVGLSTSLAGAEFYDSRAGSLIYIPSELSTYTGYNATFPFPKFSGIAANNRAISYYRTVSFTTNPLISLNLSGTVANTTNAATTTQIHADIKEGVIVIGGGTTSIDMSGSIDGSRNLISVNIPSTVTDICANAFSGCNALVYVTFSENSHLTTIGNSAFSDCTMIHDIKLPDTVTTIGQNAFNGCYNMASISIPYNVTSIGANAFNIINNSSPTTYIARPSAYLAYQLGKDIDGEAASNNSGYSVSISSDGTILAIGAYLNNATGLEAGHARVYKYQTITDTTWSNYTVNSFSNTGTAPFNKPIVVNGSDALPVSGKSYWVQLGGDINGEASFDRSGSSVSISKDGTTVAISGINNDGTAGNAGHVRVYKYDSAKTTLVTDQTSNDFGPIGWRRLGKDIDGEASSDSSSTSVSLSVDGTTVAIGASYNNGTPVGNDRGHVRVYKYDVNKTTLVTDQTSNDFGPIGWRRLGQDIDGEAAADQSGDSVSLSSDGTAVAIGAPFNDGTGNAAGHVRVYKYDVNKITNVTDQSSNDFGPIGWRRLGQDIDGEAASDNSSPVSLSADGTTVAIGASTNDGTGSNSGHVRVYKYDVNKTTLVTDQASNDFGPIGWRRLGQDIDGEATGDQCGESVSLSSDGTIVAIGALSNDGTGISAGHVRVYKYDSAKATNVTDQSSSDYGPIGWRRLCQDIDGEAAADLAGISVSLSADGNIVAIGAYGNDATGSSAGHVRVYQINPVTVPIRLHQRLYNDISGSLSTYFPGISPASVQVIPALTLTNTLNPAKLTISQINNIYIRYRQSQLGSFTRVTVSANSGGMLTPADVTTALSTSTGLVHLEFGTNVTDISQNVCLNNSRIYSVAISNTVVTIGTSAFNGCQNLAYLSFHPDSVCTTVGYAGFHNTNIIDLALPDSLTTIGASAFQSCYRITSACIPKSVSSLGSQAFHNCTKLTAVALPSSLALATYGTSSYFNINGSSTTGITFSSYSTSGAIAHFKLSDYSMPSGMVQTVVDSSVKYIDHRAYAYYPDIAIYAVTTNKQTLTGGPYTYPANNVETPIMPATYLLNGGSVISNAIFPIYRSVPDLNVFTWSNTNTVWPENQDDFYILMPGYSICIYNNLYDEENLFIDTPAFRYYDNEFGTTPLNINGTGVTNTTSSILILNEGRILTKYFLN